MSICQIKSHEQIKYFPFLLLECVQRNGFMVVRQRQKSKRESDRRCQRSSDRVVKAWQTSLQQSGREAAQGWQAGCLCQAGTRCLCVDCIFFFARFLQYCLSLRGTLSFIYTRCYCEIIIKAKQVKHLPAYRFWNSRALFWFWMTTSEESTHKKALARFIEFIEMSQSLLEAFKNVPRGAFDR